MEFTRKASSEPKPIEKRLLSRGDAAWALSISVRSVDYLIASGALKTTRLGSRVLVTAESFLKLPQKTVTSVRGAEVAA